MYSNLLNLNTLDQLHSYLNSNELSSEHIFFFLRKINRLVWIENIDLGKHPIMLDLSPKLMDEH